MRDDFETVVMPLPGEPRQWLEVKLPGDDPMDKALTWGAWIVLSLLLTATLLLLWALPVWRDMDALRNAALRMGQATWAYACGSRASPAFATSAKPSTRWPRGSRR